MSTTDQSARTGGKIEPPAEQDAEAIVRERLKTIEKDAKRAEDWPTVKGRILQQHKAQP